MNGLLQQTQLFFKRNASTILTCVGGAGVVATSVLAVKATPKALDIIKQTEEEKGEELTKFEVIKAAAPIYIPSVLVGVSTLACIFGANALNKKQQAALMSAYALLSNSHREYKKKVVDIHGEEGEHKVKGAIAEDHYVKSEIDTDDNKELFFDFFSMRYFESTMEEVRAAEYYLNKDMAVNGDTTLNSFYELLGLPRTDYGDKLGWSLEAGGAYYGYSWIDFKHEKTMLHDGPECWIISMPFEPTADYLGDF